MQRQSSREVERTSSSPTISRSSRSRCRSPAPRTEDVQSELIATGAYTVQSVETAARESTSRRRNRSLDLSPVPRVDLQRKLARLLPDDVALEGVVLVGRLRRERGEESAL